MFTSNQNKIPPPTLSELKIQNLKCILICKTFHQKGKDIFKAQILFC